MAKSRASGAAAKTAAGASVRSPDRPSYLAESEKAVKLFMTLDYYDVEKTKTVPVWIPKSQLAEDGRPGEWITGAKAAENANPALGGSMFLSYRDAQGNTFGSSMTAKERENRPKNRQPPKKRQFKYFFL